MLFYGPPGTGKTSTILALARDLYGPTLYRTRLLELNASDERGIAVIREKVKNFAKTTARETVPGFPCPPFKLILLDEADSLTGDAQTALRRVMELYSRTTRFCLVCNYVSRIIEPLTSRCAKFRFRPVDWTAGVAKLDAIVQAEGVQIAHESRDQVMRFLIENISDGDLRRAITLLQIAHRLGEPIDIPMLEELAGRIPEALLCEALQICRSSDAQSVIKFAKESIIKQAYCGVQFLTQLAESIAMDPSISTSQKSMICLRLSLADFRLTEGGGELIQIMSALAYCQTLLRPDAPSSTPAFLIQ